MTMIAIMPILLMFFVTIVFLTWLFSQKARMNERMFLIEKGIDPSTLPKCGEFKFYFPWFKIGLIITGIALGLLLGVFLNLIPFFKQVASGNLPGIFLFLFGGIGMMLAHHLDKPKAQK